MPSRNRITSKLCLILALTTLLTGQAKVVFARQVAFPAAAITADAAAFNAQKPQIPSGAVVRLVVNADTKTLTVLADQEVIGTYPVAIGKYSTPTPIGEWKIINKGYSWGGPFGARWLGLNVPWGRYGIHGTNQSGSIGYETSQGCLRMYDEDIVQFFDLVKVGTQVDIVGSPHEINLWRRPIAAGSEGPDVVYVQLTLKRKGFYPYRCDGIFGRMSDLGVRRYQFLEGLPVTGKVDEATNLRLLKKTKEDEK